MTTSHQRPPRRIGLLVVVGVLALVVGVVASSFDFFDIRRQDEVASGKTTLLRIRDLREFVATEASFQVPVVVCSNLSVFGSKPKVRSYGRGDMDKLLSECTGIGDEKAVVLVEGSVRATVDFGKLDEKAVEVDGAKVTVRLPAPELQPTVVDAADGGLTVVSKSSSFLPGGLPESYQTSAAEEGAKAIDSVAEDADLRVRAEATTRSFLEGLLRGLGFTDIVIEFEEPPKEVRR